jgi:YaaC-like Protein
VSALEQAEQMFRAAANVGPATQPLLTYYGLNQAGRAIAAAASSIDPSDGWRLEGHGIHCAAVALRDSLPDITNWCDKEGSRGSFVRLSEILDSPLWSKAQAPRLSALWDCIPENLYTVLADDVHCAPLYIDHRGISSDAHPLVSVNVSNFPARVITATDGRQALIDYLASFPGTQDYDSYHRTGRGADYSPRFLHYEDGRGGLYMNWLVKHGEPASHAEKLEFLKGRTRLYNEGWYFFPAVGDNVRSLHPLMAWWALLFTLSMLARYQPAEWAAHIDVNHSRYAASLESLLRTAIESVPKLIAEAIEAVSNP